MSSAKKRKTSSSPSTGASDKGEIANAISVLTSQAQAVIDANVPVTAPSPSAASSGPSQSSSQVASSSSSQVASSSSSPVLVASASPLDGVTAGLSQADIDTIVRALSSRMQLPPPQHNAATVAALNIAQQASAAAAFATAQQQALAQAQQDILAQQQAAAALQSAPLQATPSASQGTIRASDFQRLFTQQANKIVQRVNASVGTYSWPSTPKFLLVVDVVKTIIGP